MPAKLLIQRLAIVTFAFVGILIMWVSLGAQAPNPPKKHDDGMSPMGHKAMKLAHARARNYLRAAGLLEDSDDEPATAPVECDDNGCDPGSGDDENGPADTQSEVAIAIDSSGTHIVIGFNDFRGFSLNPASVSGYAYSDDGGATFVDGGQLPAVSNGQLADGTKLPGVFGDPDVKYVPGGAGCQFIYSSILVKGIGVSGPNFAGTAQTMSVHRSIDCGHTWTGPFEVTAATNPHGVLSGPNAFDAADKEFLSVDPDTGRVIMSWSNFTSSAFIPGFVEIRTTFSDNVMSGTPPTWSAGVILNPGSSTFDTGSMPQFAGNGSSKVHVAWATESLTTGLSNTRVATSTDNGASWAAPVTLNATNFFPIDYILGNDRVHSFPSISVGPEGNVYVVYANNRNHDGADIAFHRSTNGGVSFSPAIFVNAAPGADRAQWFPYATTAASGRVYVTYYDQGVAGSGDLTDARYNFSNDGGLTWSKASGLMSSGCHGISTDPLDCRPFHAGYGNDASQPNLGDYTGATTFNGSLYAVWAANPRRVSFADGQPTDAFTVPDFYVNQVSQDQAALAAGAIAFTDSNGNGFVDAGDELSLTVPLHNFATNAVESPVIYTGVTGTLSAVTAGVSVLTPTASYPNIAPGATQGNLSSYVVQVDQSFVPGTPIDFSLAVSSGQGATTLLFTQSTGTPVTTTIFSENFNGVSAGLLPPGWVTIHAGGSNTVRWTTNSTFCGTGSNGLFHINANDGVGGTGNPARFERVASPNIVIPATAEYVTLEFDVCYDTEDDPSFNVLAYDGALLRITDFTPGRFARANLAEAFAEQITTGSFFHYPKHGPRSNSTAYFQDMSMWSGDSAGFKHVVMKLPGMQGSTIQLRPDYTQDSFGTCADVRPGHTCGVMIDNIVMKSVVSSSTVTTATAVVSSQNPSDAGEPVTFTAIVTAGSPVTSGSVTFREGANLLAGPTPVDASGHAAFTTSALTPGVHTITADYGGSSHFAASSGSVVQTVAALPSFTIDDVTTVEGQSGNTSAVFTVTLSAATHTATAQVDFATADGTATIANNDYVAAAGTLSFPPGTVTRTISVTIIGDLVIEPTETFTLNLSNTSHATIADGQGRGTITNDDDVASTLAGLVAQVTACNGGLNSGQCQALLTRLAAAQRDLAAGRTAGAVRALEQFINEVGNFTRPIPGNGNPPRLDPVVGAVWVSEAASIIGALTP